MTVNAITDTEKGRTGIAPTYLHTTRLFQTVGPQTENARFPNSVRLLSTTAALVDADRSWRCIFRQEPPNGGSNAGGVGKKRDSGRISGCIGHVYIGAYSVSTA